MEIRPKIQRLQELLKKLWFHARILFRYWKFILGLILVSFGWGYWLKYHQQVEYATRVVETPPPKITEQTFPHLIPTGSTLSAALKSLSVSPKTIHQLVTAAKPVFDLGRLRAGTRFRLNHLTDPASEIVGLEIQLTPVEVIQVTKTTGAWSAKMVTETVESRIVTFTGTVKSNLWESAENAKMEPDLIIQLAEIFAWQIDLAREVRLQDRWRLSVEQKTVRGKTVGWGAILAAEYQSKKTSHSAILFKQTNGDIGYFSEDGSSMRHTFLKSPLRFARITSGFQKGRFHPLLKITRPHRGIDYGAPRGTPVRAVGDGVVVFAGHMGEGGKTLKIKHGSKYQTAYLHLSGFQKGIKTGARVKQGQFVAFVGSTGVATGPHLHFEFSVNGKVIDPLSFESPPVESIPPEQMDAFRAHAETVRRGLPEWKKPLLALERLAN